MAEQNLKLEFDTAPLRELLNEFEVAMHDAAALCRIADAMEKLANPPEIVTADFLEAKPDTRTVEALERIADALELANLDRFVGATSHPGLFDTVRLMVRKVVNEQTRRRS